MITQYNVAREKLFKYNAIIIMEKLDDAKYVAALERFFGLTGINDRRYQPWCEAESHYVNNMYPLEVKPKITKRLTVLNKLDSRLYYEIQDCDYDDDDDDDDDEEDVTTDDGENNFPLWDATRFEMNETLQRNLTFPCCFEVSKKWLKRFHNNTINDDEEEIPPSPVCRPHFQLALPDGSWTSNTKFKRLYFYHVRKAGVSNNTTGAYYLVNITLCSD